MSVLSDFFWPQTTKENTLVASPSSNPLQNESHIHYTRVRVNESAVGDFANFLSLLGSSAASPAGALGLYSESSIVFTPVTRIVSSFACSSIVIRTEVGIERDAFLSELLNNTFLTGIATNFLVTGEAVILAVGNVNDSPGKLISISPALLNNRTDGRPGWEISDGPGKGIYDSVITPGGNRYLHPDGLREILHVANYNPKGKNRGWSPLNVALNEIQQYSSGVLHNVSQLQNGGKLGTVFNFPADIDPEARQEIQQAIKAQFSGPQNANKVITVFGSELEITNTGISNIDMDFSTLQKEARRIVAQIFQVPLPLVDTDASTFSNYQAANLAIWDDAIIPLSEILLQAISQLLKNRRRILGSLVIDKDEIPALRSRRIQEVVTKVNTGALTINEIREQLGLEPIDGGDVLKDPPASFTLSSPSPSP